MEMAEYRDDGIWEVVPNDSPPVELITPAERPRRRDRRRQLRAQGGRHQRPAPRPLLVGWSLIFIGGSNLGLVAVIILIGLSPIGLVACAALAFSSWLLVLAELISVRRLYRE